MIPIAKYKHVYSADILEFTFYDVLCLQLWVGLRSITTRYLPVVNKR